MATKQLSVSGSITYPVFVGPNILSETLPGFIKEMGYKHIAVITNTDVAPLYGESLVEQIDGSFLIVIPEGEQYKSLDTMRDIYDELLAHGSDRSTLVISLGGGVVTDVGGFAAASFMRGIPLIQAPTSLLSMVDASIGGKTGVDLPQGKNLVGAFKDPIAVFADTATLDTLPPVEFRCGLAEVIKAALIDDASLFDRIESDGVEPIADTIERAIAVKVRVVEEDRLEKGIRAHLNLGHTFAHAFEQVSEYAWKHGEAVAIGTLAAARLSAALDMCSSELVDRIEKVLTGVGLPVRYSGYDPEAIWEAMHRDKKWHGGVSHFILLRDVGEVESVKGVEKQPVIDVLQSLKN